MKWATIPWRHYRSIFICLAVVASQSRKIRRYSDKIWPYSSSRSSKVILKGSVDKCAKNGDCVVVQDQYMLLVLELLFMAVWYGAGLTITRSWVQILPVAAVYQCQLSVPSLRSRLMSTRERWGVNGHAVAPNQWSCSFDWYPDEG